MVILFFPKIVFCFSPLCKGICAKSQYYENNLEQNFLNPPNPLFQRGKLRQLGVFLPFVKGEVSDANRGIFAFFSS